MSFLLYAAIGGILAGFPTPVPSRTDHVRVSLIAGGIAAFVWGLVAYRAMPQLVGPFFGLTTILLTVVTLGIRAFFPKDVRFHVRPVHAIAAAGLLALTIVRGCAGSGMFHAEEYRAFVQDRVEQREWQQDMTPVDPFRIRLVSQEQAEWKAKQALGQVEGAIGSKYRLGSFTIQKVGDELVWISPLEYQDFLKWASLDSTPGYVKVSAEDPGANAELVVGKRFAYMESAFFHRNLERHVYDGGFQFRGVTDYSFEVDDAGKAYWVATLYAPTIQFFGAEVTGVLLIDPETGEMTEYSPEAAPPWVDRIIPESSAAQRLRWHGSYVHGWWNSVTPEDDVTVPTQDYSKGDGPDATSSLWLVWGNDGKAYWFTGLTSSKKDNNSLTGFVLMDSRTGRTFRYALSGLDENAVIDSVNAKVANFPGYHGTQPVLYNLYGQLTWVVPVITEKGILQRVALVNAATNEVVMGQTRQGALNEYRQVLNAKKDGGSADAVLQGTISRIAADTRDGNTTYLLTLSEDATGRIFSGSSTLSLELPLARPGDRVAISVGEPDGTTVPMSSFAILPAPEQPLPGPFVRPCPDLGGGDAKPIP